MEYPVKPPPIAAPGRRRFVSGVVAGGLLTAVWPALGMTRNHSGSDTRVLSGTRFNLDIAPLAVNFTGRPRMATAINGTIPGPLLRWREGDRVTIRVTNHLKETTSIHWHGLILPYTMDGVPGVSFDGIQPGETFVYQFDIQQSGTYWYHSHSMFQEQTGVYGAIVIEPRQPERLAQDREHVILLSDWTDEDPMDIFRTLKKSNEYYNFQKRSLDDLYREIRARGVSRTFRDRQMWAEMRMSDRDISDVTGHTYTYLMNGCNPATNWTALFRPGEKVRLRFINGSAMTFFDVRIPGLKMTVVAADGMDVEPVTVEEFRIGVAETYDVVVQPESDVAYTLFAAAIDRSGYARGTLTPDTSLTAPVPELEAIPELTMMDMGMAHEGMDHGTDHGMDHGSMNHGNMDTAAATDITHDRTEFGPGVDARASAPLPRLDDPGVGLRDRPWKVLTYADLRHPGPAPDHEREPDREIELHLTGNMHRYMWSFDGVKYAHAGTLDFKLGERLRIKLVNDTMMNHPIHLHGMWSDVETGDVTYAPRKHTLVVQPGQQIAYRVTVDAPGGWAYHCHLLYHMEAGMFRVVRVVE